MENQCESCTYTFENTHQQDDNKERLLTFKSFSELFESNRLTQLVYHILKACVEQLKTEETEPSYPHM